MFDDMFGGFFSTQDRVHKVILLKDDDGEVEKLLFIDDVSRICRTEDGRCEVHFRSGGFMRVKLSMTQFCKLLSLQFTPKPAKPEGL